MYVFTPQQHCLLSLSSGIWHRRGAAKHNRLSFNEEAATESLLLDLAIAFPGKITIIPFTKRQEGIIGGDWAWAFIGPDGRSCQGMLVQAKRLDDYDQEYSSLYYRGRSVGSGGATWQMDRLIASARQWNLPPVYAFYNHLDDATRIPTNTCKTLSLIRSPLAESWGVAIASAIKVRNGMPNRKFDYHRYHCRPLHCLFCSDGTGQQHVEGLAGAAAAALSSLFDGTSEDDGLGPELLPPFEPTRALPELFRRAESAIAGRAEDEEVEFSDLRRIYPGIAGAVIVRGADED